METSGSTFISEKIQASWKRTFVFDKNDCKKFRIFRTKPFFDSNLQTTGQGTANRTSCHGKWTEKSAARTVGLCLQKSAKAANLSTGEFFEICRKSHRFI